MMKETIRALETGAMAEIGLLAFFVAFVLILAYTFLLPKQQCETMSQMPLDDDQPIRTA